MSKKECEKQLARKKRHKRIRKKVSGTATRPRLSIFRSLRNTYVQLIDDENSRTVLAISSSSPEFKEKIKYSGNVKAASLLGKTLSEKCKDKGIAELVFDRSGYLYHGRIKALAEGAREGGLKF